MMVEQLVCSLILAGGIYYVFRRTEFYKKFKLWCME